MHYKNIDERHMMNDYRPSVSPDMLIDDSAGSLLDAQYISHERVKKCETAPPAFHQKVTTF